MCQLIRVCIFVRHFHIMGRAFIASKLGGVLSGMRMMAYVSPSC